MTSPAPKPLSCWKLFLLCLGCGFAAATALNMVSAYSAGQEPMPYAAQD
jgi:hypothetical protein